MSNTTTADPAAFTPVFNESQVLGVYYSATAPRPVAHQDMELAIIIISLGFSIFLIALRIFVKLQRMKALKAGDYWMIAAGIVTIFPMLVCQIGANRMGGGLHAWNITNEEALKWWRYTWGFVAYYIITSLLKISVLVGFLTIMPRHFKKLRMAVHALSAIIMALGITCALMLLFQCQPFLSNFDYNVLQESCINTDYLRFFWTGLSITFDLFICSIPFQILYHTQLRRHERTILLMVFVATFLGTIACAINIYGIISSKEELQLQDLTYYATIVIICYDFEILMYAIGCFLPTLSPFLIKTLDHVTQKGSREGSGMRKSWLPSSISGRRLDVSTHGTHGRMSKLPSQIDNENESSLFSHEMKPTSKDNSTINVNQIYVSSDIRVDSEVTDIVGEKGHHDRRVSIGLGNI